MDGEFLFSSDSWSIPSSAFEVSNVGKVERAVIEGAIQAVQSGATYVSEAELQAVAKAASNGGKAAVYAVERLNRRGLLASVWNSSGNVRLGYTPIPKAHTELASGENA